MASDNVDKSSDRPSDASDKPSDRALLVRPDGGRSIRQVLELIYNGVTALERVDADRTRFILGGTGDTRRAVVPMLTLAFEDGETWHVGVVRGDDQ